MKMFIILTLTIALSIAQDDKPATMLEDKYTLTEEKLATIDDKLASPTDTKTTQEDELKMTEKKLLDSLKKESIDVDETRDASRIAGGVEAIAGENLDYALLHVFFQNQAQICGGVLVHPDYVVTTASCVKE